MAAANHGPQALVGCAVRFFLGIFLNYLLRACDSDAIDHFFRELFGNICCVRCDCVVVIPQSWDLMATAFCVLHHKTVKLAKWPHFANFTVFFVTGRVMICPSYYCGSYYCVASIIRAEEP